MHTKKVVMNDIRAFVLESSLKLQNKARDSSSRPSSYSQTVHGTKNYTDSLQRAFNRVKQQIFFNTDMIYFVTLTYKGADHTSEQVLHDLKMFMKNQRRKGLDPKYVAVMEYQKRGSIHVHMITNEQLNFEKNKNGYYHLPDWTKGFTSVLTINDVDSNFRPYLYLFKYMKKAQRIGKSFVHSSRNLNNFHELPIDYFDMKLYTQLTTERSEAILPDGKKVIYIKYYFERN